MKAEKGLVSIIIPAFNQGHYLREAVQSCLSQTYPFFEILIIDDGSTDNTAEVAKSFSDSRVKYIFQENRGLPAARNTGIRNSQGEYLTFLDSDDCFLSRKLELLLDKMKQNPSLGFVAGRAILIDQNGDIIPREFETILPSPIQKLTLGNPFHVGSVLVKKEWQERIGYFDESLRSYEDWDFWLRLAIAGCPMKVIPEPVSKYRFHTGQMTRKGVQMTNANMAVLEKLFSTAGLSDDWERMKPLAYAHAHLRATAHGYLSSDFSFAHFHLRKALSLDPTLAEDNYKELKNIFAGWTELPKTDQPIAFLSTIYQNLPEELDDLQKEHNLIIGRAALNEAFQAYHNKNFSKARKLVWKAFFTYPPLFKNFGAFTVLIKSILKSPVPLINSNTKE